MTKFFDDAKKSCLYDRFTVSNGNFTTEFVKVLKNSKFFKVFSKFLKFQVFSLNCQISGFSMFPGKVATLYRSSELVSRIVT